jgi:tetratricopeptide (TPR) repeat protein
VPHVHDLLDRLKADGWAVATHEGRWFPLGLFASVAEALDTCTAEFPEREDALAVLSSPGPEDTKLGLVLLLLDRAPLALHFTDFDLNLNEDGYADPGFEEVIFRMRGAANRGRLFVTSRVAPPDGLEALEPPTRAAPALAGLSEHELETLLQLALATFPLTERDVAAVVRDYAAGTTAGLVERGLLSQRRDGVVVERWVAEALAPLQGERLADRHERAITMHYDKTHSDRRTYSDYVAVTRHLAAVDGMGDLTKFALDLTRNDRGCAAAALLGEVTPVVPAGNGHYLPLRERQITTLIHLNFLSAAGEAGRRTLRDVDAWAQTYPERDPARFCLGAAHNIFGVALIEAGDLATAEPIFKKAVDIYHELGAEHPTSFEAHRRLGWALEHLGAVYQGLDRPDDADDLLRTLAECAHVRTQCFEAQPGPDTALPASTALKRLAEHSDPENARAFLTSRLTMLTAMVAAHPDNDELEEELADAVSALAAR